MKKNHFRLAINYLPFLFSLVYAILLSYSDLIFGYSFDLVKDRTNYQAYFKLGANLFVGGLGFDSILSEPGFIIFMVATSALFDNAIMAVRGLIAISSFIFSFSLLKIDRLSWGIKLLVLFSPWILVNYVMTLRQGLALALFMYAYFHGSPRVKIIVYSVLPLIHYLFWIVIGLLVTATIIRKLKISVGVASLLFLLISCSILIVLYLLILDYDIFSSGELNKLLAVYQNKLDFEIGFGWLFWFLVFIIFFSQRLSFIKENYLPLLFLLLYLTLTPFFPPISRVMQVGAPIILVAALRNFGLSGSRRIMLLYMITFHIFYFLVLSIESGGPRDMIYGQ